MNAYSSLCHTTSHILLLKEPAQAFRTSFKQKFSEALPTEASKIKASGVNVSKD